MLFDIKSMLVIIVVACVLVLFAMIIDLASGLYKASQRGEAKSSSKFKRTLTKFVTYEGSLLIAASVDILIHYCKLLQLFHLDIIYGVPIITCLLAIFLLAVEMYSVRENTDQAVKDEMNKTAKVAAAMVNKEELIEALTKAIIEARNTDNKTEE